jgi:DNA-binding LacI/PurR family transcriptional regulator
VPTTVLDAAETLHISIYSISRALNGYEDAAHQVHPLLMRTANKTGDMPHRAARQTSETTGFILPSISEGIDEPFFVEFIREWGVQSYRKNSHVRVSNAVSDDEEHALCSRWENSHKAGGLILNRTLKDGGWVSDLPPLRTPFIRVVSPMIE